MFSLIVSAAIFAACPCQQCPNGVCPLQDSAVSTATAIDVKVAIPAKQQAIKAAVSGVANDENPRRHKPFRRTLKAVGRVIVKPFGR